MHFRYSAKVRNLEGSNGSPERLLFSGAGSKAVSVGEELEVINSGPLKAIPLWLTTSSVLRAFLRAFLGAFTFGVSFSSFAASGGGVERSVMS